MHKQKEYLSFFIFLFPFKNRNSSFLPPPSPKNSSDYAQRSHQRKPKKDTPTSKRTPPFHPPPSHLSSMRVLTFSSGIVEILFSLLVTPPPSLPPQGRHQHNPRTQRSYSSSPPPSAPPHPMYFTLVGNSGVLSLPPPPARENFCCFVSYTRLFHGKARSLLLSPCAFRAIPAGLPSLDSTAPPPPPPLPLPSSSTRECNPKKACPPLRG